VKRALLGLCLLAGCEGSVGSSPLHAESLALREVRAPAVKTEGGGFADERGGGIFADPSGQAVRLRVDGTMAKLQSHPGNPKPPGLVQRVFRAGPFAALMTADNGLYVAESGWLIAPTWRDVLDAPGVIAVSAEMDGVTWIAHQRGLFHVEQGQLAELKVEGQSLLGLSALAVAPARDGGNAVWFAQGEQLGYAEQVARTRYEVHEGGLTKEDLAGGVRALAGLSRSPSQRGELRLITDRALYKLTPRGWDTIALEGAPEQLVASGRFLWLRTDQALFRYDGDERRWGRAEQQGELLAVEPAGSAWLDRAGQTTVLSSGPVPRLLGIFEGMRVYATELAVRAQFSGAQPPSQVTFQLDEREPRVQPASEGLMGEGAQSTLDFAWGGFDSVGREQPHSMAGVAQGMHTLRITATFADGSQERVVHFDYQGGDHAALSFAKDVLPIATARCAKCHEKGPGHTLSSYEQWSAEKAQIVGALVEGRMPADGPLDPDQLATIQRWVYGGAAP
jgi:hypothetical protein